MIHVGTELFVREILVEHAETLTFLWALRDAMLRDSRRSHRDLVDLDERIVAHVDGLVLAAEQAIAVVEEGLASNDPAQSLASALVLLSLNEPSGPRLALDALRTASGGQLAGITRAFCHAPQVSIARELRDFVTAGVETVALAAAEVLAYRGEGAHLTGRLIALAASDSAVSRRAVWRVYALMVSAEPPPDAQELGALCRAAIEDPDLAVREQALEAAVWSRQPWVLDSFRSMAKRPAASEIPMLRLFASLAAPSDLMLLTELASRASLGPTRWELLGALGHPVGMELILAGLANEDVLTACAAATAFERITGINVESDVRVPMGSKGEAPDGFDSEFLEDAAVPDVEKATRTWANLHESFSGGTRWCHGIDVSLATPPAVLARVGLISRRDALLRDRYRGVWKGGLADLDRFPQSPVSPLGGR